MAAGRQCTRALNGDPAPRREPAARVTLPGCQGVFTPDGVLSLGRAAIGRVPPPRRPRGRAPLVPARRRRGARWGCGETRAARQDGQNLCRDRLTRCEMVLQGSRGRVGPRIPIPANRDRVPCRPLLLHGVYDCRDADHGQAGGCAHGGDRGRSLQRRQAKHPALRRARRLRTAGRRLTESSQQRHRDKDGGHLAQRLPSAKDELAGGRA